MARQAKPTPLSPLCCTHQPKTRPEGPVDYGAGCEGQVDGGRISAAHDFEQAAEGDDVVDHEDDHTGGAPEGKRVV